MKPLPATEWGCCLGWLDGKNDRCVRRGGFLKCKPVDIGHMINTGSVILAAVN